MCWYKMDITVSVVRKDLQIDQAGHKKPARFNYLTAYVHIYLYGLHKPQMSTNKRNEPNSASENTSLRTENDPFLSCEIFHKFGNRCWQSLEYDWWNIGSEHMENNTQMFNDPYIAPYYLNLASIVIRKSHETWFSKRMPRT